MSYQRSKGRSKTPTFVMLRFDIMDSPAWLSLPPNAQALWCHIKRRYNGHNNGEISYACREAAERLNVSPNTANRAFIELEKKGFIKAALFAGFQNKHRTATRWIITSEEHNGKKPTNEWRNWREDNAEKN